MQLSISRLPATIARTGLSRSNIYSQVSKGTFPRPIALGARAVGWLNSELDEWLSQQVDKSRPVKYRQAPSVKAAMSPRSTGQEEIAGVDGDLMMLLNPAPSMETLALEPITAPMRQQGRTSPNKTSGNKQNMKKEGAES